MSAPKGRPGSDLIASVKAWFASNYAHQRARALLNQAKASKPSFIKLVYPFELQSEQLRKLLKERGYREIELSNKTVANSIAFEDQTLEELLDILYGRPVGSEELAIVIMESHRLSLSLNFRRTQFKYASKRLFTPPYDLILEDPFVPNPTIAYADTCDSIEVIDGPREIRFKLGELFVDWVSHGQIAEKSVINVNFDGVRVNGIVRDPI